VSSREDAGIVAPEPQVLARCLVDESINRNVATAPAVSVLHLDADDDVSAFGGHVHEGVDAGHVTEVVAPPRRSVFNL
jgi:hypothetical protein